MSKMNKLAMELEEQASELGFESLEQAEQAGYEVDYENAKLIEPQEAAHEAWLKEKEQVLSGLKSLIEFEDFQEKMLGDEYIDTGAKEILKRACDFVEKGEC